MHGIASNIPPEELWFNGISTPGKNNWVTKYQTLFMEKITDFSETNTLISEWISELRDITIQNDRMRFRKNMSRIGEVIAYEISKVLKYEKHTFNTPLCETISNRLKKQPVVATILRAGVPLYDGILNYFDKADCAFIGSYRQHSEDGSVGINQQYVTTPSIEGRPLIVADPMLATGSSLIQALTSLLENGTPSEIHVVSVLSSPIGIENLRKAFPNIFIWVGSIDKGLNNKGYIVPGLGDAGDLSYGQKLVS